MPTYEYACKACGQHLEVVQSFKDSALTECPACGGPLRKVFGNIGVSFKGSGFYKTDSRSDGRKAGQTSPDTKPDASGGDAVKSGESSPASTPQSAGKDKGAGKDNGAGKDKSPGKDQSGGSKPDSPKSSGSTAVAAAS